MGFWELELDADARSRNVSSFFVGPLGRNELKLLQPFLLFDFYFLVDALFMRRKRDWSMMYSGLTYIN